MPFLMQTALTCARAVAAVRVITVPSSSGVCVAWIVQRDAVLLDRQDAARMQHLRAAAGDFLRLVVVERAQQPRAGHRARVRR